MPALPNPRMQPKAALSRGAARAGSAGRCGGPPGAVVLAPEFSARPYRGDTYGFGDMADSAGRLRPEFQPNSSTAVIDFLHPNRAGYLAMARTIDLDLLAPPYGGHRRRNR